jgi:hypothetical protein
VRAGDRRNRCLASDRYELKAVYIVDGKRRLECQRGLYAYRDPAAARRSSRHSSYSRANHEPIIEMGNDGGVDGVVLQCLDHHGGREAAVLAHLSNTRIEGGDEKDASASTIRRARPTPMLRNEHMPEYTSCSRVAGRRTSLDRLRSRLASRTEAAKT